MLSNKQESTNQRLHSIGYTHKLPMPIAATANYQINNEDQILENIKQPPKLNNHQETVLATTRQFPYENKKGFELIIDDAFITQHQGIKIHHCSDFKITFTVGSKCLHKSTKFFIEITDSQTFVIKNIDTVKGRNVLLISHSGDFLITKCTIKQAEGYAIIIHQSKQFQISQCLLEANLASAIMIIGASTKGLINDCQCLASTGYFNFDAGIHLCATSTVMTVADIPEQCHEALSIEEKTCRPYGIVIENCILSYNRAQGLYLEGAVNCLFQYNQIVNNNKEGICLDWGSCHNIVKHNLIANNGERKNLSNNELTADFISHYPILEDGSSSMKLAGISIDNGCINLITKNKITDNYGGGVKLVRTALLNLIEHNIISHNTLGSNPYSCFFHGISIKGLGAINNEFNDKQIKLLDFLPSQLNTFSKNVIRDPVGLINNDKVSIYNHLINNNNSIYQLYIYHFIFIFNQLSQTINRRVIKYLKRYFG